MFLAFSRPDLLSILANILTASKPISTNYQLEQTRLIESIQCVKSFHIRSYSGPHFSRIFSHFHRIRSISPCSVQIREQLMMNCFSCMVDRRKTFSFISSWDHCHRSSPWRISDTARGGFEAAQNLSEGLVEWSCVLVITTTPRLENAWKMKIIITSNTERFTQ